MILSLNSTKFIYYYVAHVKIDLNTVKKSCAAPIYAYCTRSKFSILQKLIVRLEFWNIKVVTKKISARINLKLLRNFAWDGH